jgi:uncharacterized protein
MTQPPNRQEQPVPVLLSRAWQRHDQAALENFSLQSARGFLFLSGQITSVLANVPCFVTYGVVCAEDWSTREAHVHVTRGGDPSLIRLTRSTTGLWEVDGVPRPDLDGVIDLDIEWTPATNALPLNRVKLEIGESREVDAAWVRVPDLTVERLRQKYTRVREDAYRYESGDGSFVAELEVDDARFVERYGEIWTCVGRS